MFFHKVGIVDEINKSGSEMKLGADPFQHLEGVFRLHPKGVTDIGYQRSASPFGKPPEQG
jgi:hypothetical protein